MTISVSKSRAILTHIARVEFRNQGFRGLCQVGGPNLIQQNEVDLKFVKWTSSFWELQNKGMNLDSQHTVHFFRVAKWEQRFQDLQNEGGSVVNFKVCYTKRFIQEMRGLNLKLTIWEGPFWSPKDERIHLFRNSQNYVIKFAE